MNLSPAIQTAIEALEEQKPDGFEIYFSKRTSMQIESKEQLVDSLTRSEDVGIAIRAVDQKRLGFSYTTSLDPSAIRTAVANACAIAKLMPSDPHVELFSFGSVAYPSIDNFDEAGLEAPIEQKIELAKSLESACRKADSRITGVRSASFSEVQVQVQMVDSLGESIGYQKTLFSAGVTCKAEANGDSQVWSDFDFSNDLTGLDVSKTAILAAKGAVELLGAGPAPTMRCPAILRNNTVAELIEFLASSFSSEEIDKGRSMLAGKEGERIFSEQVTLVDDRLMPRGYATSPFDAEGVPASQTLLVEGGVFENALYNPYYARKFGKTANSCSSRSVKAPPSIGFSNLYLKPGKKSFAKLLDGISKGILITDLMGLHTANPVTGDFSLGASGILIENGKPTKPVRGFAVAGNIMELFRRMTDISNDTRFFGNVGAPSVRVTEISVGGS